MRWRAGEGGGTPETEPHEVLLTQSGVEGKLVTRVILGYGSGN